MPKSKIIQQKSPKANELTEQHKALRSKNKNLKFFKSIQKTQQNLNTEYLVKPPHLREPKIPTSKSNNFLAKLERPQDPKKNIDEDYYDYGKKLYSDEQSTHANALFESGEIYQNFITKNKSRQLENKKQAEARPQPRQNDKNRTQSESKIIRDSLKNKMLELKMLQKRQDKQMEEHRLKSTAEEVHRLQKIQAIERQMLEQEMEGFQTKIKQRSDIKVVQSYLSAKKL